MPKVAVSRYTKVRLLTIIRKQPYRHVSTAICFHYTISLKSSGFDDCMSGISGYGGVSTAGVAAVRLLSCSSRCAPAVSVLATVFPIVDPASDPATYTNYPFRLSFLLSLRLFFRLLSTVTFPTTCSPGRF